MSKCSLNLSSVEEILQEQKSPTVMMKRHGLLENYFLCENEKSSTSSQELRLKPRTLKVF